VTGRSGPQNACWNSVARGITDWVGGEALKQFYIGASEKGDA